MPLQPPSALTERAFGHVQTQNRVLQAGGWRDLLTSTPHFLAGVYPLILPIPLGCVCCPGMRVWGLCVLLFIYFANALQHSPLFNVPLPSAWSCQATRRKSLLLPINLLAACVSQGKGFFKTAQKATVQEGKEKPGERRRTLDLFGAFSGPRERASPEGLGSTWSKFCQFPA